MVTRSEQKSLNTLRNEIHEWAKEKGFWPSHIRIETENHPFFLATKICLIHSEVSEAWEAWNNEDERSFKEELADVAIRAFDLAGALHIDIEEALYHASNPNHPYTGDNHHYMETIDNLLQLHKQCSDCLEALRHDPTGAHETIHYTIPFIIQLTELIFIDHDYINPSWYQTLTWKIRINNERPFKHGKAF